MNFKFLTGDVDWKEYGGKFVSKRLNNGEFDYWLVLDVCRGQNQTDEDVYYLYMSAVAPSLLDEDKRKAALESFGLDEDDEKRFLDESGDVAWVEIASTYGYDMVVENNSGRNIRDLMQWARQTANYVEENFFDYTDSLANMLGATGLDVLKGNPIPERIRQ